MPRLLPATTALTVALAALTLALPASAQTAYWESTFAVPGFRHADASGPPAQVYALARHGADVYAGGRFDGMDDAVSLNVAHWDGTAWHPLGGVEHAAPSTQRAEVRALAVTPDGSVYVGGSFSHAIQPDGTRLLSPGIARWDGTQWHAGGRGLCPTGQAVHALAVEPGGTVVMGGPFGCFVQSDGTELHGGGVARWTGSAWESLGVVDGDVLALTFSPTGTLVATGDITRVQQPIGPGLPGGGIYAWDGMEWSTLVPAPTMSRALQYIGTDLYVGGDDITLPLPGGSTFSSNGIARWDGARWHPVGEGLTPTTNPMGVYTLMEDDGTLLVGGGFNEIVDLSWPYEVTRGLARWTGTAWEPAGYGVTGVPFDSPTVYALLHDAEGGILFGGWFGGVHSADGGHLPARGLARHGADGLSAVSARPAPQGLGGLNASVYDLAPSACGPLLVGGEFGGVGPRPAPGLAAWDGNAWAVPFTPPPVFSELWTATVLALTPADCTDGAGRFFISGSLSDMHQPDGTRFPDTMDDVARWDGAQWAPLGGGLTQGGARVLLPDGDGVYAGGSFMTAVQTDGTPVQMRGLGHWSPDAGWTPAGRLVGQAELQVMSLLRLPDGSVVAAGAFEGVQQPGSPTTLPALNVARWDGTAWHTFGGPRRLSPAIYPGYVNALARDAGGRLIVGGLIDEVVNPDGSVAPAWNVAAWDGTTWTALGDELDGLIVTALAVDARGRLFAAAICLLDQPQPAPHPPSLFVWDGATWTPIPGSPSLNVLQNIWALAFDDDGRLAHRPRHALRPHARRGAEPHPRPRFFPFHTPGGCPRPSRRLRRARPRGRRARRRRVRGRGARGDAQRGATGAGGVSGPPHGRGRDGRPPPHRCPLICPTAPRPRDAPPPSLRAPLRGSRGPGRAPPRAPGAGPVPRRPVGGHLRRPGPPRPDPGGEPDAPDDAPGHGPAGERPLRRRAVPGDRRPPHAGHRALGRHGLAPPRRRRDERGLHRPPLRQCPGVRA